MEGRTRAGPRAGRWRKGAPFRVTLLVLLVTPLAGGILGHWAASRGGLPPPLTTYPSVPTAATTWDLVIPAIYVNPGQAGSDWGDCPWVNGSGTPGDPYRIANVTVTGGGTATCVEIRDTMAYFRVENLTCVNAGGTNAAGIKLASAGNGTLYNNTCINTGTHGIYLQGAENTTLAWNNCTDNGDYGIYCTGTFNLTFTGNNCSENRLSGIRFLSSHNMTLTGNYFVTDEGNALALMSGSTNATIEGNTFQGAWLELSGTTNVTLTGNDFTGTSGGISLAQEHNLTLTGNEFGVGGIYWDESSASTPDLYRIRNWSITPDNLAGGNPIRFLVDEVSAVIPGDAGQVFLVNCNDTTVAGRGVPLMLYSCHNVSVTGNTCPAGTPTGIKVLFSGNLTLAENDCSGAYGYGIHFQDSSNVTTRGNTCADVLFGGIYIDGGANHTLTGNNCSKAQMWGVYLTGSDNATLIGNNASASSQQGIFVAQSHNATLAGNTCGYNGLAGILLRKANDTVLTGNWLGANPTGLGVEETENLTATGTTFWKSTTYAFDLDAKTNDCEVLASTIAKADPDAYRDLGFDNVIGSITHVGFPEAHAQATTLTVVANEGLTLAGSAKNGTTPYTCTWSPGDGTADLPGLSVVHAYATAGDFTATLTVTDADGDVAQDTVQVHVLADLQPTASAAASNSTPATGQEVTFTATATGGNAPLTYAWDWGDGTPAGSGATATHAFAAAGTYTVTLTVTDADGDATTATLTLTVSAQASGGDDEPRKDDGNNDIGTPLSPFLFVVVGCTAIIFIISRTRR